MSAFTPKWITLLPCREQLSYQGSVGETLLVISKGLQQRRREVPAGDYSYYDKKTCG